MKKNRKQEFGTYPSTPSKGKEHARIEGMAKKTPGLPDKYSEKLDFMYTLLQKKLDNVDAGYALLGTKTSILLGFASTAVVFYLGFLFQYTLLACFPCLLYWLRVGALGGLVLVVICLCISIYTREFDDPPHIDFVFGKEPQDEYFEKTPLEVGYYTMKRQILAELRKGYIANKDTLRCATNWYKASVWLLLGSVLLMIISSLMR